MWASHSETKVKLCYGGGIQNKLLLFEMQDVSFPVELQINALILLFCKQSWRFQ